MKKIVIHNNSDVNDAFALILVSETMNRGMFRYTDVLIERKQCTEEMEVYNLKNVEQ